MLNCPDTIIEFEDQLKQMKLCRVELYNQAKARIESGDANSVSEASRQLAEETGRSVETIRNAIRRGDEAGHLTSLSGTDKYQPVTPNLNNLELSHGGARVGAGRPFASSEKISHIAIGDEEILENARLILAEKRALSNENKPHVSNNSGNQEWYTPSYIIEAARDVMGSIDCDPASCEIANKNINATTFYDAISDGLQNKWNGNVWLNPPYSSSNMVEFSNAVVDRYKSSEINTACVLVNNATETVWFKNMMINCDAVCFLSGRVKYLDENNIPSKTPLQGQAVIYFGKNVEIFKSKFCNLGTVLKHA